MQKTLDSLRLGHVWHTELVGDEVAWKKRLKKSIRAREEMEWKAKLEEKPKLRLYRTLKFDLEQEDYLNVIQDSEARRLMTALRGGTNMLAVEKDRWKHKDLKKRTCSVCANGSTEDELHFLLECTAYERERRA